MKQKRAVLYELMRDHRGAGANGVTGGRLRDLQPAAASEDASEEPAAQLAPARANRLPLGYILLGVSALLIIALAAYLVGHSKGRGNEALGAQRQVAPDDVQGGAIDQEVSLPLRDENQGRSSSNSGTQALRTAGPIESNPRTIGKNYFVLVQTSRTNAIRVAEFCRARGLEAYVDRVNNADFRVFVLPGYTAEEMASPAVGELERRIEEAKKAWNDSVGRSDLGQHIAVKYRG